MLWIVGKISRDYSEYFAHRQIPYGVFADHVITRPPTKGVPVIEADFSSEEALLASITSVSARPVVDGLVVAGYEHYVLPAARLARYFKVPGPSIESAVAATDKSVMRECFKQHAPGITPEFTIVRSWQDIAQFMAVHEYPVILKPTNLMKSLFVTKNSSLAELKKNYEQTVAALPAHYRNLGARIEPGVLLEEFLSGSMHTIAAFADKSGEVHLAEPVVDCMTARDIGIDDSYLFSRSLPSRLPAKQQEAIREAARQGVEALGLRSTPAHVEIMLTGSGPKIIEIGARIGGYRPRLYEYASGIDLYKAAVDIAHGERPDLKATKTAYSAAIELFPANTGVFSHVANLDALTELPGLKHYTIKRQPGEKIGPASHGYRAPLLVLLSYDKEALLHSAIEFIRQEVKVITA